tara:strand:- start:13977 stop:14345 length:369 start_codon:yes stop_codon:yes gene_type:complete
MGLALCVIAAGKTTAITAAAFTLSWTHSVEKTEWLENWRVTPAGLELTEARVKGSGAGMDPGEGARLEDGWWVWSPDGPMVPELVLAASGATLSAWRLCHAGGCMELGSKAGKPVRISGCER